MGYMGFGLQKWIYSQRPRKPFSHEMKKSFDSLPNHSVKKFNISGLASRNPKFIENQIFQMKRKIRSRWIRNKITGLILAIVLIISLAFLFSKNFHYINAASKEPDNKRETRLNNDKKTEFDLALSYAQYYLEKGDYDLAIIEFKNALKHEPSNIYARNELAKTYYLTCIKNDKNCDEAIKQFSELISTDSSSVYFKYRSELYMHIGDFNSATMDIDRIENANN